MSVFIIDAFVAMKNQIFSNPNYELLREQILRLQSDTKLFNAKVETIHAEMLALKKDHKIDLNVQNMEINELNEKVTELLTNSTNSVTLPSSSKRTMGLGRVIYLPFRITFLTKGLVFHPLFFILHFLHNYPGINIKKPVQWNVGRDA